MTGFIRLIKVLFSFLLFGSGAGVISFLIFPYIKLTVPKDKQISEYANIVRSSWRFFINLIQKLDIVKIHYNNRAKLNNLSGKIVVASHPSFIDIIILISEIPNSVCLAKKDTLKNPLFRNIVKSVYIINDIDLDLLKAESEQLLKQGFNIVIFPTGTRTKPYEKLKLHKGSAVISLHSNAGIVPVKITTDYPFLQKGEPIYNVGKKPVNYFIDIKEEISPEAFSHLPDIKARKEIMEQVKKAIQ